MASTLITLLAGSGIATIVSIGFQYHLRKRRERSLLFAVVTEHVFAYKKMVDLYDQLNGRGSNRFLTKASIARLVTDEDMSEIVSTFSDTNFLQALFFLRERYLHIAIHLTEGARGASEAHRIDTMIRRNPTIPGYSSETGEFHTTGNGLGVELARYAAQGEARQLSALAFASDAPGCFPGKDVTFEAMTRYTRTILEYADKHCAESFSSTFLPRMDFSELNLMLSSAEKKWKTIESSFRSNQNQAG